VSEADLERYSSHYRLLGDRYGLLRYRVSMMSVWIFQPIMGTAAGQLETSMQLLMLVLEEVSSIPSSVHAFQAKLESVVAEIREIHSSIVIDWDSPTDESLTAALNAYWSKREIGAKVMHLPQQMREIEVDLRPIYPHYDMTLNTLERNARHINAALEVLANPDEPDLPQELFYWSKTLDIARYLVADIMRNPEKVLDEDTLQHLLKASEHSLLDIRLEATRSLASSPDEKSVTALLRLINDSVEVVRKSAVIALGVIGSRWRSDDQRIVDSLTTARDNDSSHDVSTEASRSLKRIRQSRL
jgi:hypothetical protein